MFFLLADDFGLRGGGELLIRAGRDHGTLQVTLRAVPAGASVAEPRSTESLPPGLEPARDLIQSERGQLLAVREDGGFCLQVRFPAGGD